MRFLAWIVTGVIAGWLTGLVVKGRGYGLVGDLVVGLLGGLTGGWLFHLFGWAARNWLAETTVAAVGGVVLVTLVRLLRRLGYRFSTSWP
jgi:uncharacterized membrane protein YeaQ/YmgE (transglycosylase-associated protein family)